MGRRCHQVFLQKRNEKGFGDFAFRQGKAISDSFVADFAFGGVDTPVSAGQFVWALSVAFGEFLEGLTALILS